MSYTFATLELAKLPKALREQYSLLIPPKYRCCLEGKDPDDISFAKIVAVGVVTGGVPVGIAVAGNYEDTGLAELYCFKILEEHRDDAVGKELLRRIEGECFETGAVIINYNFRKTEGDSSFNLKVFEDNSWSKPKLIVERYFFDGYNFYPSWYEHPPKLPKKFKLFHWKNLKERERKALESDLFQGQFSAYESPFQNEKEIEMINSLGLRHKGQIVGWSITHRIAPDTIRYTILFIRPEFQSTGYGIRLLVESTKLQQKSPIRWAVFELNLEIDNESWIRFVRRRLAPYSISIDQIYQSWKAQNPDIFSPIHN